MNQRDRLVLAEVLARCTVSVLKSHGVDAACVETFGSAPDGFVMAFVGFTGRELRGTLVLDASKALLERSYPAGAPGVTTADEDLCDWSGEITNLLLGQVKRELSGRGVTIQLSTPVVISSEAMCAHPSARPIESITHRFEAAGARARVRLDVAAEPNFALATQRPPSLARGVDAFLFDG